MPRANIIRAVVLMTIVSIFLLGVIQLFRLRFEAGDVYPPYSTLRSDPLGGRAFYRSLENLDNISVRRNYQQLTNLEFEEPSTLYYLGASAFDSASVDEEWVEVIERLTDAGGRLVLSVLPVEKKPANWRISTCAASPADESDDQNAAESDQSVDAEAAADKGTPSEGASPPPLSPEKTQCIDLREKWGLVLTFADTPATEAVRTNPDQASAGMAGLPESISWHTALYFDELDDNWRVIYTAEGRAVMLERFYGNGSLVLSADTFFMSNEALRSERYPQLLAWTIGQNKQIVFDETHLGIQKHPGVLSLIKQYRFHWFIFAIAVLVVLFIWKNSVYFVPPPKSRHDPSGQDVYASRDSTQGLISLLRRNIPVRQLLPTCGHEWRRTFEHHQRFAVDPNDSAHTVFETIKAFEASSNDPVVGYRKICKIISKGRHHE